ncbi:MAG: STAS domain-containing protein [Anaerolineales bacterium]|nr:STAS domain-containing protein [Anaerolineales bacterium]MCB8952014.1 STAS domain-containing protein [Ardenticatenales bacterium]
MSDLAISVQNLKRVDVVTVSGRIDSSNYGDLDNALQELFAQNRFMLVLDLNGVNYISSAGLRILVSGLRECKKGKSDGNLVLLAPSERVTEVLGLSGLSELFRSYEKAVEAVGSF